MRVALAVLQTVLDGCGVVAAERSEGARGRDRQADERAMAYVARRDRSWPYSFEDPCETIGWTRGSLCRPLARGQVSSE
jgi:hypothetical protein